MKKLPSSPRESDWIMGKNCLKELLAYHPERILQVYTALDLEDREDPLLKEVEIKRIPIERVSKQTLFSLVHSDSHQSWVAKVKKRTFGDLSSFLNQTSSSSLLLMVDTIFDPQNLGAILRAAECFQVDGVLWSPNRGTAFTPVVAKASNGASEIVPIISVANLADSLLLLKEAGYAIITAEVEKDSLDLRSFSFPSHSVLVMGSEGKGIQPRIRKLSDFRVHISLYGRITSLNVSQATSIFLFQWKKTLSQKAKNYEG